MGVNLSHMDATQNFLELCQEDLPLPAMFSSIPPPLIFINYTSTKVQPSFEVPQIMLKIQ